MNDIITVVGAREHNLKNVTVSFPKNKLVVITGPSGSGKSSLALDILYVEGKRRYMESLSSYARQFLGIPKKPDFERIDGLCPSIAIEQKTVGSNPRSTVGTITEIYDYFRILFARIGVPHCPSCGVIIDAQSPGKIADSIVTRFPEKLITIVAPYAIEKKGEFIHEIIELMKKGFYRLMIDGKMHKFTHEKEVAALKLKKTIKHNIDIVIDSFTIEDQDSLSRLQEAITRSFGLADEMCKILVDKDQFLYSSKRMCLQCNIAFPELEPRFFSFNSPIGACSRCHGLGEHLKYNYGSSVHQDYSTVGEYMIPCAQCHGMRLKPEALAVKIDKKNIFELCELSIEKLLLFFENIALNDSAKEISKDLRKEIENRLGFLANVGLTYLSLNRSARTLSGGEGQRIRLAKQVGSALSGVLYILDEPSIGLHQRDNDRLIVTLQSLRDLGNTVLVVEHDMDTMKIADYLIDMGPAAGVHGGQVTAFGTPAELQANPHSLTGKYMSGALSIPVPKIRKKPKKWLKLSHARANNLQDLTVEFPLEVMCGVSGVSGSGKSSLIFQELVPAILKSITRFDISNLGGSADIEGTNQIKNLVQIDQSPIGKTSRSNPGTYIGIFDDIRKFFAAVPESRARGYEVGQFSFNRPLGRCYECSGDGTISVSMHFLPDVVMICKVCKGKRYNQETLQILYNGKTIADVLDMTAFEACEFFAAHKILSKKLQLLCDVGLDYIKIGQSSTTLSGGEAQRIKLVNELAKRDTSTLYILDEPTTGLHSHDIVKLLGVLERLISKGNSIIVIEHNLDVLKTVDYLIDLGPDGGDKGGMIVAKGTPEQVAAVPASFTGKYLKEVL